MELMEESLENRLKNVEVFTGEKNDFTMIPISFMQNWLRKAFLSNISGKKTGETVKLFTVSIF